MKKLILVSLILFFSLTLLSFSHLAAEELSTGSTIFVPAYRSFYQIYGTTRDSYALTNTVFLHNIDPQRAVEIYSIDFCDSTGTLVKKLIEKPFLLKPRNSKEITLQPRTQPDEDATTYLIVRWKSDQPANAPLVEVLMVGQVMNRGISFSTQGREVKK